MGKGRLKEKSDYVSAVEKVLGDVSPELKKALHGVKSQHLMLLTKSISDRYGIDMPDFPNKTPAQQERISIFQGKQNEAGTISSVTESDH